MSLLTARVWRPAMPLRSVAPDVPERVARLVDALLATSPDDRPSTATEALALLRDGARLASGPELPRLGGDQPVRSVVEAALSGRSVDVVGPRGAGATRLLADVEAALAAAGRPVRRTVVDRKPLASLAGALGAPSVSPGATFTDAASAVEQRLREVLEQGAVVLVDDADRIDAPSAAVIDHARALGAVVRVRPGAPAPAACVELHALSPASLATLFRGPERIAHLPSDAAQALWARTDGLAARVAEELEAWLRAGIARRDGASFVVDREGLDLLASGMPLTQRAPPAATSSTSPTLLTLPPELDELLGYIVLAWPNTSLAVLAAVSGAASWRIAAGAEELARHGFVRRLPDGRCLPLCALTPHDRLSDGARRRVHAAIAASIAPATSGRLLHLMSSEAEEGERAIDVVAESCAVARAMASAGKGGHALAVLDATASYLRRATVALGERPRLESDLFALWAIVALTELTPRALDPLHYALSRVPAPRPELLDALAALVRAALDLGSDPARALASVTLLPSFGDIDLDRRAHGVRLAAARRFAGGYAQHLAALEPWVFGRADEADAARCRAVREHDVLPELEPVVADRLRLARAAQHGWLGWLRYREGRFEDAAAHHELAAAGEPWLGPRLGAMLNAASAHMEAFHYARADELARAVLVDAARARQMSLEARAEWLLRLIAYRRGDPVQPDLELVAAIEALGGGDIEAQTLLTEAIVAWRVGAHDLGRRLSERPRQYWVSTRWEVGALLAACIHVACGGEVTDDEARELVAKSVRCSQPLIGLQTLALIARRAPADVAACGDAPAALAASLPVERWVERLDVMSAREALASITDATRP